MTDIALQKLEKSLEILSETHRYDLIIDTALKILSLDPQNLYATYELLRAYNNTHQYEKLIESTTRALSIWPNNDILYEFVYLYYLSKGGLEYLKARDAMLKAVELNPNNAAWHRNLAEIYLINREPEKAEKYLTNAVKLKPLNAEYRSRLALSQIRLHKVKESLEKIGIKKENANDYVEVSKG